MLHEFLFKHSTTAEPMSHYRAPWSSGLYRIFRFAGFDCAAVAQAPRLVTCPEGQWNFHSPHHLPIQSVPYEVCDLGGHLRRYLQTNSANSNTDAHIMPANQLRSVLEQTGPMAKTQAGLLLDCLQRMVPTQVLKDTGSCVNHMGLMQYQRPIKPVLP